MKKNKILIVDDEPFARYPLALMLKKTKCAVHEAGDGEEALDLILEAENQGCPFDLLVTDLQMPNMSGIELIGELERHGIAFPIVVISGTEDERLIEKLLSNNLSDYFRKPYKLMELVARINKFLEKAAEKSRRN